MTGQRTPILRFGAALLVSIRIDMDDQPAVLLQDDLSSAIVKNGARAVMIDISVGRGLSGRENSSMNSRSTRRSGAESA
jgi:hypothetical protein